ncbi:hypothetical protein GIB67_016233 [Kingdonia uniflora]|uniref:Trimethylguanosine synthase n=1 Tax=Kingdonia uniflora TaxID=39325 RepID=A0A7J7LTC3_9MAGN|nr:hypothetical protein GIB67_016233 [Kingdonia uniflora]
METDSVIDGSHIKKLRDLHLFSITVAQLWDDHGEEDRRNSSWYAHNDNSKFRSNRVCNGLTEGLELDDTCRSLEDIELTQMEDMGLPRSFNTSKKRNIMAKGKKNKMRALSEMEHLYARKGRWEEALEVPKASDGEGFNAMHFDDTIALAFRSDVSEEVSEHHSACECVPSVCESGITSCEVGEKGAYDELSSVTGNCDVDTDNAHVSLMSEGAIRVDAHPTNLDSIFFLGNLDQVVGLGDSKPFEHKCRQGSSMDSGDAESEKLCVYNIIEQPKFLDSGVSSESSVMSDLAFQDKYEYYGDVGELSVYLETVSKCYYYYNFKTQEWVDQPGAEYLAYFGTTFNPSYVTADASSSSEHQDELNGLISCSKTRKNSDEVLSSDIDSFLNNINQLVSEEVMSSTTGELARQQEPLSYEREEKARTVWGLGNISSSTNNEMQCEGMPEKYPIENRKYRLQKCSLFWKFDDGIRMDEEAWFSVTPESVARHHALRCTNSGIVVDCFTGVGGNAIQLAKRGHHVIAIDIDPIKIDYAQHNAAIYGVDDSIEFIKGDFFGLAPKLKAQTVFLSPPWGGPDYAKVRVYQLTMLKPHDGYFLFNTARKIGSAIVMYLPRNVDINQLAELALSVHPPMELEIEKNFLNGKFKAITAYFNDTSV